VVFDICRQKPPTVPLQNLHCVSPRDERQGTEGTDTHLVMPIKCQEEVLITTTTEGEATSSCLSTQRKNRKKKAVPRKHEIHQNLVRCLIDVDILQDFSGIPTGSMSHWNLFLTWTCFFRQKLKCEATRIIFGPF
jgi:hypothetical protein